MLRVVLSIVGVMAVVACQTANPIYCGDDAPCPSGLACASEHVCVAGFALDEAGFYADGNVLWTATEQPVLAGSTAVPGALIEVAVDGVVLGPATVEGQDWSFALPAGVLQDGKPVALQLTQTVDGKRVEIARMLGADLQAPHAEFDASQSNNEAFDEIVWEADGAPRHNHQSKILVLDGSRCETFPRYRHLLMAPNEFQRENAPNPLVWRFAVRTRVAFTPASTRYRIMAGDKPIVDWTPIHLEPKATRASIEVPISAVTSDAFVNGSGSYQIEVIATDWALRETKLQGCWNLELLPPPVQVSEVVTAGPNSLQQWPRNGLVAMINATEPFKIFERTFSNGTTEAVDIVIDVTHMDDAIVQSNASSHIDAYRWAAPLPRPPFGAGVRCYESEGLRCMFQPYMFTRPSPPVAVDVRAGQPWRTLFTLTEGAACSAVSPTQLACRLSARNGAARPAVTAVAVIDRIIGINPTEGVVTDHDDTFMNVGKWTGPARRSLERRCYESDTVREDRGPRRPPLLTTYCTLVEDTSERTTIDRVFISLNHADFELKTALVNGAVAPPIVPAFPANPSAIVWEAEGL